MSLLRAALAAGALASGVLLVAPTWAQTAAEPRAASDLASGSEDMRALERQVESVLAEARRQQTLLNVQRQRLSAAESANAWLPLLFMALAVLAMGCGVLGLQLWRIRRQLEKLQRGADAVATPATAVASAERNPARVSGQMPERPLLGGQGGASVRLPIDLPQVRPRPVPMLGGELASGSRDFSFGTGVPPRPVSVEELLDLDQQVEFFLALGQAQSAIDLLLGHVRSTGGTNAQPYFKLLEIYRDQGDEEAYERTRERFNQRFNALAPGWTGDLAGGRLLEDYAEVVQRLQRAWPQPMRAVAELEGLLLRRADLEPFDLPAYRDVLMLHALVRDLPAASLSGGEADAAVAPATAQRTAPAVLARELPPERVLHRGNTPGLGSAGAADGWPAPGFAGGQGGGHAVATVDLLLPLGEHTLDITLPQPHLAERPKAQAMLADWVFSRTGRGQELAPESGGSGSGERPSSPMRLDLDLSEHAPAPREFTRPAAFTDIDMRRDRRLSDLGGLDEGDPLPSRR